MSDLAKARQTAFNILAQHGDCLRDDTVMDDLIEGISDALLGVAQPAAMPKLENLADRFVSIIQDGMAQQAGSKSIASMIINELLLLRIVSAPQLSSTYQQSPALNWSLDRPECPRCKGQGRVGMIACNDCGATGSVVTSTNQGGGK